MNITAPSLKRLTAILPLPEGEGRGEGEFCRAAVPGKANYAPRTFRTPCRATARRRRAHSALRPAFTARQPSLVTRHLSHGFTLIEILIAMGILSLVLAAIFSTWTAILRASKVGNEAAAAVQRTRIAVRTLEESLGSAQAFAAHQQLHPEYYSFIAENGSEGSLSFVARLAKSFPRSGRFGDLDVRRVTFTVESAPDSTRQLVLRQQPLVTKLDVDEKEHPIVLAKNVKEFQIECWDTRRNDWVDEWRDNLTNTLPPMVKVTLKVAINPQSSQAQDQITRIVSLPSIAVQPYWQIPRLPGGPGVPGGPQPGQPVQPPQPVRPQPGKFQP